MKAKKFLEVLHYDISDRNSSKFFAFRPICLRGYIIKSSISKISFVQSGYEQKITIKDIFDNLERFPYKEVRFYSPDRKSYLDLDHLRIGEISLERCSGSGSYRHFEFSGLVWKNHE